MAAGARDNARLFQRTLIVMAAIGTALLAWNIVQLLLLLFFSVLVAVMIHDFARALMRWTKVPFYGALMLAILLPLIVLSVVFGLFGTIMYGQFTDLANRLPAEFKGFREWMESFAAGRQALAVTESYAPRMEAIFGFAQSALTNIGSAASALAVIAVAGVYLAAQPSLYVDGVLSLLSPPRAVQVRANFAAIHAALTAWLKGQAVGMAFVAVGTSIGLTLVGLPSGLALGPVAARSGP